MTGTYVKNAKPKKNGRGGLATALENRKPSPFDEFDLSVVPGLSAVVVHRLKTELQVKTVGDLQRNAEDRHLTLYGVFRSIPLCLHEDVCTASVAVIDALFASGNGKAPEVPAPAPAGGHAPADDDDQDLVRVIPLARITTSPLNPRKHFDEQKIAELALSIRTRGVLSPIVVRPHPRAGAGPHAYELVAGERRFRAAAAAGLNSIPAMVRRLSDKDALEVMVIENEQREDVGPLEKADGYHELTKLGVSPTEIAQRVGKSDTTIRRLLKLRNLPDVAAKALADGVLAVDQADQIARVPGEKTRQKVALHVLAGDTWWDRQIRSVPKGAEPLSSRQTRDLIHHHCMVELKGAPFDREAPDLVPAAGTCAACPKRVGNLRMADPEAYDGIRADVCTDPECYRAKVDAHGQRAIAAARAAGCKVLTQEQTERDHLFDWEGKLTYSSDYVELSQKCFEDPRKRTYEKLVGEACSRDVVVAIDKKGHAHRLVPKAKAGPALKAAGVGAGKPSNRLAHSAENARNQQQSAASRAKQEAGRKAGLQAQALVVEKAETMFRCMEVVSPAVLARVRALVADMFDAVWHDVKQRVLKRRGCNESEMEKMIAGDLSAPQLLGLAAELSAARKAHGWGHPHFGGDHDREFFEPWGIEKAELMKAAAAEKAKGKKVKT